MAPLLNLGLRAQLEFQIHLQILASLGFFIALEKWFLILNPFKNHMHFVAFPAISSPKKKKKKNH